MLTDLILIGVICLVAAYWLEALKANDIALALVGAHCRSLEVQLLDDYVALKGIRLKRSKSGKIQIQRSFMFEFSSTGLERYNGSLLMLGHKVESIYMEPYRIEQACSFPDK